MSLNSELGTLNIVGQVSVTTTTATVTNSQDSSRIANGALPSPTRLYEGVVLLIIGAPNGITATAGPLQYVGEVRNGDFIICENAGGSFSWIKRDNTTPVNIPNSPDSSLAPLPITNLASSGVIGTAAATVDINSAFVITQTTAGITATLANPTNVTGSRIVYLMNAPASTQAITFYGQSLTPGMTGEAFWNGSIRTAVGVLNVIAEKGTVYTAGSASIGANTTSSSAVDIGGLSFTINTVGDYMITVGGMSFNPANYPVSGISKPFFALYTLANVLVANTETLVSGSQSNAADSTVVQGTGSAIRELSNLPAGTYKIRGWCEGGSTNGGSMGGSTTGKAVVTWRKSAGNIPVTGIAPGHAELITTTGAGNGSSTSFNDTALQLTIVTTGTNSNVVAYFRGTQGNTVTAGDWVLAYAIDGGTEQVIYSTNSNTGGGAGNISGQATFTGIAPGTHVIKLRQRNTVGGGNGTILSGDSNRPNVLTAQEILAGTPGYVADMVGATSGAAGQHGMVPAPAAGQQNFPLRGDGTFRSTILTLVSNGTNSGTLGGVTFTINNGDPRTLTTSVTATGSTQSIIQQFGVGAAWDYRTTASSGASGLLNRGKNWNAATSGPIGIVSASYSSHCVGQLVANGNTYRIQAVSNAANGICFIEQVN